MHLRQDELILNVTVSVVVFERSGGFDVEPVGLWTEAADNKILVKL
jgi:hypothetical protein